MRGHYARSFHTFRASAMALLLVSLATAGPAQEAPPLAREILGATSVSWQPAIPYETVALIVVDPDGAVLTRTWRPGEAITVKLSEVQSSPLDGTYTWELRFAPVLDAATRAALAEARESGDDTVVRRLRRAGKLPSEPQVLSGTFLVDAGLIVPKDGVEPRDAARGGSGLAAGPAVSGGLAPLDVVHTDDVIITGSLCVGYDCGIDGSESFGTDTVKLKENTLRLFFDDTSTMGGFSANDWRIVANDQTSGGASHLSVEDVSGDRTPVRVDAGARNNAIRVSSSGWLGLGTATPAFYIHSVWGDTPGIRLDQDGGPWTPQVWDVAGNEMNFFVRDPTHGNVLPFRIQPGTPTSTLTLRANNRVGLGTWTPSYPVEVNRTGEDATLAVTRTDGATGYISSTADVVGPPDIPAEVRFGSVTNHRVALDVNGTPRMVLSTAGDVGIGTTSPAERLDVAGNIAVSGAVDGRDVSDDGIALDTARAWLAHTRTGVIPAASCGPTPSSGLGGCWARVTFAQPYESASSYSVSITPVGTQVIERFQIVEKTAAGFVVWLSTRAGLVEVDWQTQPVGS